jgi:hypothetical protein
MFTSIRSFRPTRAALIAAAIVLAAVSGASARSGPSASGQGSSSQGSSGQGSHGESGHRASLAAPVRVIGPPIMKPGDKHHHHARIRFFDWYRVNPCAAYDPRYVSLRRVDWLARCRVIEQPVAY